MINRADIIHKVKETLVIAGSTFSEDKKEAYRKAIAKEPPGTSRWVLEKTLENAFIAEKNRSPLCDDTGIPHLFFEVGPNKSVGGELINAVHDGVVEGLRVLPGRPMAIKGNDLQRLDQTGGLDMDPGVVLSAPIMIKPIIEDLIRLTILLHGGGPEIRGKTYRVFHKHSLSVVIDEIVSWATESTRQLGCSPVTLAIGIGRSHYEATSLMLEAMVYGNHNIQNDIEKEITERLNNSKIGPLGLGGNTTALSTFLKIGPQRASGVRIVSMRPCCSIEPRKASVIL